MCARISVLRVYGEKVDSFYKLGQNFCFERIYTYNRIYRI